MCVTNWYVYLCTFNLSAVEMLVGDEITETSKICVNDRQQTFIMGKISYLHKIEGNGQFFLLIEFRLLNLLLL